MPEASSRRLVVCSTDVPSAGGASMDILRCLLEYCGERFTVLSLILPDEKKLNHVALQSFKDAWEKPGLHDVVCVPVPGIYRSRRHSLEAVRCATLPKAAADAIAAFRPDTIFCYDHAAAGILSKVPAVRKVTWLGDLHFQTHWHRGLYAIRESWMQLFLLPLFWWKKVQWEAAYRRALLDSDFVIVSAKSAEYQLARLGITSTYLPYPWPGLSFDPALAPPADHPSYLFFGQLSGLGSRSALHFLLEKIYPALVQEWGEGRFTISICGTKTLPAWAEGKITSMPGIRFLGFADDLASLIRTHHAVIVPIQVPGSRTRVLTAMSCAAPVVLFTNTAAAIPDLVDGDTCYLATTETSFIEKMKQAYKDRDTAQKIGQRARETYLTTYEPSYALHQFTERFF